MTEMVRNNPADVVYNTFSQAFFQGMVKMFQNDNEMRNIVMTGKPGAVQVARAHQLTLRHVGRLSVLHVTHR